MVGAGLWDYWKGEFRELLVAGAVALLFLLQLVRPPAPNIGVAVALETLLIILILVFYRFGRAGLADVIYPPSLAFLLPYVSPASIVAGVVGGAVALLLHVARVARHLCNGLRGGLSWVRASEEVRRAWYIIPEGVSPNADNRVVEEAKKQWEEGHCYRAFVGVPLLWVYSLFYLGVLVCGLLGL